MALTLQRAGFEVNGTDVQAPARQAMAARGLHVFEPDDLPRSDVYLLSLPTSAHVEEVILRAPGLLAHAPRGSVIMDASTSDPESSKVLAAKVLAAGLEWLDAPVSGGPLGATNGTLGMLLGGDRATVDRLRPVLQALSAKATHVGGPGCGHVVKLANNFLCATHLLSTAQALAMATRAGVEPAACLEGINSGSGRSAVSEVNFPRWVLSDAFDSGFTMGLMRKDLRLALQAARALGLPDDFMQGVLDAWQAEPELLPDSADFNRIVQRFFQNGDRP